MKTIPSAPFPIEYPWAACSCATLIATPLIATLRMGILCILVLGLVSCGNDQPETSNDETSVANHEPIDDGFIQPSAATTSETAQILNLAQFPLMPKAQTPLNQTLANLTYQAKGDIDSAYNYHAQQLLKMGWDELPNRYRSEKSTNATFEKNDFKLSVMVNAGTSGSVNILIQHHGNQSLNKIKLAPKLKSLAISPHTVIYTTSAPINTTVEANRDALLSAGWNPYGTSGQILYFKKNAVRLAVSTSVSSAQAGKTVVSLASQLLSADLPIPEDAKGANYHDSSQSLTYTSSLSKEKIFDFYREALTKMGWSVSLHKTAQIEDKEVLTFRNSAKDLILLSIGKGAESSFNVSIQQHSEAQLANMTKQLESQAEVQKKKSKK